MKYLKTKESLCVFLLLALGNFPAFAAGSDSAAWLRSTGVIGTVLLVVVVLAVTLIIGLIKFNDFFAKLKKKRKIEDHLDLKDEITGLEDKEVDQILEQRKKAGKYKLKGDELAGSEKAWDKKGIISEVSHDPKPRFFDKKQKSNILLETAPELKKLTMFYLGASAFWLLFGTLVGEFLGLKFIWPSLDHFSWLSFGRLRPVHTNTVFWGFASLSMLGLAHFVIARTSNARLYSYRLSWIGWLLINLCVIFGNLFLMGGVNNGGGEYREYIWPVMALFIISILILFYNFYMTVANRNIKEIYISNWYIFAGMIWTGVLATVGYLPFYQDGLGQTVTAGYYMHQGVGMWFMTFTLGLIYYYLPATLNKPIYSYALGVLALWTQMLFYTLIGTHHFIFSPLPWWLQTVAIVFSVGMVIPVAAGTTNFLLTMRGRWDHISKSYVLPFFLVGVIFYFVGSMQGSLQATRFTNYVWHFTDFNVAHSHLTMYGIIAFILWACTYTIVPKLTGKEPKTYLVGGHFWLALLGLFLYSFPLMWGGTLKGLSWLQGEPFMKSVELMTPYWVWRAVGGSLMLVSHFIFAYNLYYMFSHKTDPSQVSESDVAENQIPENKETVNI
ncbi:MAG TPA: cbb3-type cytochrome c oxidase subunit I [Flavobacteriaceae bacterium]|nr:cbb3-type cytochrome c oxidase subunit I [Flavobacteriaceae bacterium]